MDNPTYNSLANKLIQNGIIKTNENSTPINTESENFFEIKSEEEKAPVNIPISFKKNKKRLNDYDLDLINNKNTEENITETNASYNSVRRFLNFKQNLLKHGKATIPEIIFSKFFPRIYEARLLKQAMSKFLELDIDTQTLLQKTIPYGENETRYKDLVLYLNYVNELQTRLKNKIN